MAALLYLQLAYTSNFGPDYRKLSVRIFVLPGPGAIFLLYPLS